MWINSATVFWGGKRGGGGGGQVQISGLRDGEGAVVSPDLIFGPTFVSRWISLKKTGIKI